MICTRHVTPCSTQDEYDNVVHTYDSETCNSENSQFMIGRLKLTIGITALN